VCCMITLIAAASLNNVISNDGNIPWRLPNDFKYFKEVTSGSSIIMGRKTFDSLPGVLPNRKHVVITRDTTIIHPNPDVVFVNSLEEAFDVTNALKLSAPEVFVIGGGEIYAQSMKYANRILLTRVITECPGDAFFPEISESDFVLKSSMMNYADDKHKFDYQFEKWIRKI